MIARNKPLESQETSHADDTIHDAMNPSQHEALVADIFNHCHDVSALADRHGMTLADLAGWANQPGHLDALAKLTDLADMQTQVLLSRSRMSVVARLIELSGYAQSRELARKASVDLLKLDLRNTKNRKDLPTCQRGSDHSMTDMKSAISSWAKTRRKSHGKHDAQTHGERKGSSTECAKDTKSMTSAGLEMISINVADHVNDSPDVFFGGVGVPPVNVYGAVGVSPAVRQKVESFSSAPSSKLIDHASAQPEAHFSFAVFSGQDVIGTFHDEITTSHAQTFTIQTVASSSSAPSANSVIESPNFHQKYHTAASEKVWHDLCTNSSLVWDSNRTSGKNDEPVVPLVSAEDAASAGLDRNYVCEAMTQSEPGDPIELGGKHCAQGCPLPGDEADLRFCARQKQWRDQQMASLYDIARIIGDTTSHEQTLHDILEVLERRLGMVRGTIMLLTSDDNTLEVAAVRHQGDSPDSSVRYQRGEGITGAVLDSGQPLVVRSVRREPRFRDRVHSRLEDDSRGDVSFVCVPIKQGMHVVGTLSVDMPEEMEHWLDEARQSLTIIATMIGYDVRARRQEREEQQALQEENLRLRDALHERFRPENIIGNSHAMRQCYLRIQQVAASDTTVLIRGESGTGKELAASAIHYASPRCDGPFVKVNCAALNESLLESELFGHERGAFTGAVERRIGRLEEADGGTLFLDEIGEFTPAIQVKLLRFLQEMEFERVGSNTTIRSDVRVLAATNRDLEAAVKEGAFRNDLYYRVNVFPINLPPLRDRGGDVLLLANHFAAEYGQQMGKPIHRISTPAINTLNSYHWPGNVRELENCIEHAVLLSQEGVIHSHNLPPTLEMPGKSERRDQQLGSLEARVEALERDMISDALKRSGGNAAAASRELGLTSRQIRYKIKSLGIDLPANS